MFDKIENIAIKRRVKNHLIGRDHIFFAVIQPGFEETSRRELGSIGLRLNDEVIEGGTEFKGRLDSCYSASLLSRTTARIMMRISEFRSLNYFELERLIRSFPWELYISPGTEIVFRTSTAKSMIYHTGKLEEIFYTGIVERLNNYNIDIESENTLCRQTLFLRNCRDICTVSLDASGEFLYKRGEGKKTVQAPLRETTAALILFEAGIAGYNLVLDPMCGSGTFSLEAASILTKTPPSCERMFPFKHWPCFREAAFRFIKNNAMKNIIPQDRINQKIITSDFDKKSVETTETNIPERFNTIIKPVVSDFFSIPADIVSGTRTLIVLNPPYGKRLNDGGDRLFYREIGKKIRKDFGNCGYAVIVPGEEKEKALDLPYDRKIPFMNGGIKAAVIFKDA